MVVPSWFGFASSILLYTFGLFWVLAFHLDYQVGYSLHTNCELLLIFSHELMNWIYCLFFPGAQCCLFPNSRAIGCCWNYHYPFLYVYLCFHYIGPNLILQNIISVGTHCEAIWHGELELNDIFIAFLFFWFSHLYIVECIQVFLYFCFLGTLSFLCFFFFVFFSSSSNYQ